MASCPKCIAGHAANSFMGHVCTSGSSQVANRTAHIASLLGDVLSRSNKIPRALSEYAHVQYIKRAMPYSIVILCLVRQLTS